MSRYIVIAKRSYTPLVDDTDEVMPGNIGALKNGLQALLAEDADDDMRAARKWAAAAALLSEEAENDHGGAQSSVIVNDDFCMESLHPCFSV